QELFTQLYRNQPKFIAFNNEKSLFGLANSNKDFLNWLNVNYTLLDPNQTEGLLLYKRKY
ncbi:MAG: hypothetical protein AB1489_20345, partial [Acidobacteriota bacterium]